MQSSVIQVPIRIGPMEFMAYIGDPPCNTDTDLTAPVHNHAHYELRLFRSGQALLRSGDREFLMGAGDLCVTPPYEYHVTMPLRAEPYCYYSLCFSFSETGAGIRDASARGRELAALLGRAVTVHDGSGWLLTLFGRIEEEFAARRGGFPDSVKTLLAALLVSAMRLLCPELSLLYDDDISAYNSQRERAIEAFFAHRYMQDVGIGDLARALCLCPRQVNRILQGLYGCSFVRKLVDTRIENAKILLLYSGESVARIGPRCGFPSPNHFHTTFRKYAGLSPHQFRKKDGDARLF